MPKIWPSKLIFNIKNHLNIVLKSMYYWNKWLLHFNLRENCSIRAPCTCLSILVILVVKFSISWIWILEQLDYVVQNMYLNQMKNHLIHLGLLNNAWIVLIEKYSIYPYGKFSIINIAILTMISKWTLWAL